MSDSIGQLSLKNIGKFELKDFEQLEHIVNDRDSPIRLKIKGFTE